MLSVRQIYCWAAKATATNSDEKRALKRAEAICGSPTLSDEEEIEGGK